MSKDTFEVILLTGRPASGKSEILDFLQHTLASERQARFHIGELDVLDDFPMLWTWFEEDDLLSRKLGMPRLHTDPDGYFNPPGLWHLLIERLSLEFHKRLRDPDYLTRTTALIEFSRGSEHGGYREAFRHLSAEVLCRAAIVYVRVSFAESLRKNRRRFNPDRPDSILEHGLSDEKLDRLYREDDWAELAPSENGTMEIQGQRLPYVVFENEDDVTTGKTARLGDRLETTLGQLWDLHMHP
jgi:energy-coupling factor transporter ATP-binding protein EcfA2